MKATRTGMRGYAMSERAARSSTGGWWEDLTSNINWNPTYSPLWSSTVAPTLNVVGTAFGSPVPVGTALTTALGGSTAPTAAPAPAPAPAPYSPYTTGAGGDALAAAAPAGGIPTWVWWTLGAAGVGGVAWYMSTRPRTGRA